MTDKTAGPEMNPRRTIHLFGKTIHLPQSRPMRISIGSGLILLGCFGFLPILGFWMIPVGLLVLSHDVAWARRYRRRSTVWWERRRRRPPGNTHT